MTDILEHLNSVRHGVMFVIEAPSGTGKTTVIKKLLEEDEHLNWSVSVTTRKRREGEVDGVDYHYVSDEEYDKLLAEDAFYEYVDSQYGCRYGTLRSEVDGFINVGKDVIFDMDWDGLRQLKEKAPDEARPHDHGQHPQEAPRRHEGKPHGFLDTGQAAHQG